MILLIEIETEKNMQIVDITSKVEEAVDASDVQEGICLIYTIHTTTGIVVNEAESGLIHDILRRLASLVPTGEGYLHDKIDSNAHSHLQAILLGNSQILPVIDGKLNLGTWQKVLFIELDGPRRRKVLVKVIPE